MAAFRGMHVLPAKHSFGKCDRKVWQTDDGQSDPCVSLCFASDTKIVASFKVKFTCNQKISPSTRNALAKYKSSALYCAEVMTIFLDICQTLWPWPLNLSWKSIGITIWHLCLVGWAIEEIYEKKHVQHLLNFIFMIAFGHNSII